MGAGPKQKPQAKEWGHGENGNLFIKCRERGPWFDLTLSCRCRQVLDYIIADPLEIPHGGELESRGVPVCSWRSDSGARARKIDEGKKQGETTAAYDLTLSPPSERCAPLSERWNRLARISLNFTLECVAESLRLRAAVSVRDEFATLLQTLLVEIEISVSRQRARKTKEERKKTKQKKKQQQQQQQNKKKRRKETKKERKKRNQSLI